MSCLIGASADKSYVIDTCVKALSFASPSGYVCQTSESKVARAWTTACQLTGAFMNGTCPSDVAFQAKVIEKDFLSDYLECAALCAAGAMFCLILARLKS